MGLYINVNSRGENLPAEGKIRALISDGAYLAPKPVSFQENLICVIRNGFFDAAGYMFSEQEFRVFNDSSDDREKVWLIYEHAKEVAK